MTVESPLTERKKILIRLIDKISKLDTAELAIVEGVIPTPQSEIDTAEMTPVNLEVEEIKEAKAAKV